MSCCCFTAELLTGTSWRNWAGFRSSAKLYTDLGQLMPTDFDSWGNWLLLLQTAGRKLGVLEEVGREGAVYLGEVCGQPCRTWLGQSVSKKKWANQLNLVAGQPATFGLLLLGICPCGWLSPLLRVTRSLMMYFCPFFDLALEVVIDGERWA